MSLQRHSKAIHRRARGSLGLPAALDIRLTIVRRVYQRARAVQGDGRGLALPEPPGAADALDGTRALHKRPLGLRVGQDGGVW